MPKGGKQPGAGRPKGSYTRPQFKDFITKTEIKKLVDEAKKQAFEKPEILKFVMEQIFGKAPQSVDLTSKGQPILPTEEKRKEVERAIIIYLDAREQKTKNNQ